MESTTAVAALGALAHQTRLQIFRLLVRAGAGGMAVGRIAEALGVEANGRLTFHLKELVAAGLAASRQEGRFVYYSTDYAAMNEVWDDWVPEGTAPARACVEAKLANPGYRVEMVVTAAC